jgi:16S rRNA (guanine527-N7)-methyltransferase
MTTPGVALSGGGASPPEEARLDRPREPLPTDVGSLPDLPAAYRLELERCLAALDLTLAVEARDAIEGHVRLLLAWTQAINLTSITDPAAVARLHVADSLSALSLVEAGPHATLLDLGSGGGFPGLPLAAALPETRVTLVDSVAKKVAFLEAARHAMGLADRVTAVTSRAEGVSPADAGGGDGGWDVVTARAVGSLGDLVEIGLPLLGRGGRLIAWKRGDLAAELASGERAAGFLGGSPPLVQEVPAAVSLPGHLLVVIAKARPTPPGFPRDPGARRRRPW